MEKNNNYIEILNLMKQSGKRDGLQEIISKGSTNTKSQRRDPLGHFVIKSSALTPTPHTDMVVNALNTEDDTIQNSNNCE